MEIMHLKLKLKDYYDQENYFKGMTWCFWPYAICFHYQHSIDHIDVEKLWIKQTEGAWREELRKGDEIDIEIEIEEHLKLGDDSCEGKG